LALSDVKISLAAFRQLELECEKKASDSWYSEKTIIRALNNEGKNVIIFSDIYTTIETINHSGSYSAILFHGPQDRGHFDICEFVLIERPPLYYVNMYDVDEDRNEFLL
jgi:hypothetical protein